MSYFKDPSAPRTWRTWATLLKTRDEAEQIASNHKTWTKWHVLFIEMPE